MPSLPAPRKINATMPSSKGKAVRSPHIAYVAIDPGSAGGLACVYNGGVLFYEPLDSDSELDNWNTINGLLRRIETETSIINFLRSSDVVVGIEWINPGFKGSGKSSMSKLYGSYMQLRGFLIAAGLGFETINPQKWQKTLGLTKLGTDTSDKWKKKLKAKAQQLFPRLPLWQKAQVHQLKVCDAILMANYLYNLRKE